MNRLPLFLIAVLSGFVLTTASAAAAKVADSRSQVAAIPETFQGTIVSVNKNELMLSTTHGEKSFVVVDEAMIVLNGVQVAVDELKPGYFATVTAEQDGQQWTANFVNAKLQM